MTTATETGTRIERLRADVMRRGGSCLPAANPFIRDVAQRAAWKEDRSVVQVRAAFLLELVRRAEVPVFPEWTLAGEHLNHTFGLSDPKLAGETGRMAGLGLSPEEIAETVSWFEAWRRWQPAVDIGEYDPGTAIGLGTWGIGGLFWARGWIENHSVRDYPKILRLGYAGIRREVETAMAAADPADPEYPRKENFWRAALLVCEAGVLLGRRYAGGAREAAAAAVDPADRSRLEAMAAACEHAPAEGARTLAEAVQSLWLAHVLTCGEDGINANSIGRLDRMLQPYYAADLKAGRTTREAAVELMAELACKLYLEYDVQGITLGGLDERGKSAVCEMSRIILDATERVGFVRDIGVRLNKQTPPDFLDRCARLVARGGGIPFFFNDECFVPALADRGIPLKDARGYAFIGCIELTIPGKANPHAVSGWFSSTKCLELALFDGADPRTGEQMGPRTGALTDFSSYDELWSAYVRQVEHFARKMVYHCNRGELAQRERGPLPCWSVLTDACIERGRDITDGGPLYNYHSIAFLGTANTADSLMAVRKLVFEEKRIAPAELLAALRADFEGCEPLRRLLAAAPKYGNDEPAVDAIAAAVADSFISLMDGFRSPLGGRYFVHLFSFLCNLHFGKSVGAIPDGRKAGEPLAYSLSAHQGRDITGVSAMLKSLARLPHGRAAGASAAIIEMDPKLVEGEAGMKRLSQILQAIVGMGIGQVQFNVVTAERLRQAQRDPEKYGNISVRVAGFSQMFRLVAKDLQDHIIARTKHRE